MKTFKVDLSTTERLAARLREWPGRDQRLIVAESGIQTRADVARLARAGADAFLVGESLMRDGDIQARMAELLAD